jgi:hypothetical protein
VKTNETAINKLSKNACLEGICSEVQYSQTDLSVIIYNMFFSRLLLNRTEENIVYEYSILIARPNVNV